MSHFERILETFVIMIKRGLASSEKADNERNDSHIEITWNESKKEDKKFSFLFRATGGPFPRDIEAIEGIFVGDGSPTFDFFPSRKTKLSSIKQMLHKGRVERKESVWKANVA